MVRKRALVAALALSMVGSISAGAKTNKLQFYTGGDQGTYYAFGNVLAEVITEQTGEKIKVKTSGGSQANLEAIDDGAADLAFVQSDVMDYAYSGARLFANGGSICGFSVVAALYSEQVQIVTTDPTIQTVEDLKGKTVSVGASGSGVYYNAMDILDAYDLTELDITAVYQSFGESSESLAAGEIDAAFVVSGAPTTAISFLSESTDIYLVSMDDEHIEALIAKYPYYSKAVISADTYGLAEDAVTVDVDAVLVASDDVSEDDVYNIVSAIFDNVDAITEEHSKGAELDLAMATSVTTVPYHAGAAKYFAEQGITVTTK